MVWTADSQPENSQAVSSSRRRCGAVAFSLNPPQLLLHLLPLLFLLQSKWYTEHNIKAFFVYALSCLLVFFTQSSVHQCILIGCRLVAGGAYFCWPVLATAAVMETQHYIRQLMMLTSKRLSFPVSCNSHVWHKPALHSYDSGRDD